MDYTFCSFTYNQEEYILQHLESIKFQIEHFGKGIECRYILADDHSTDRTAEIVEKWVDKNKGLFAKTDFLVNEKNQGIVSNYTKALRHIETQYFQILAGDDFYYKNSIFDIFEEDRNYYISPLIYLDQNDQIAEGFYDLIRNVILCGDDSDRIKRFLQKQYRYSGNVDSPGVIYSGKLIDQGLLDTLQPYKWIEDAPEIAYLIHQDHTKIKAVTKPLVVYRTGVGITSREKNEEYLADRKRLSQTVHTRRKHIPKPVNPFLYAKKAEQIAVKIRSLADPDARKRVRELETIIAKEKKEAMTYIRYIMDEAEKQR